MTQTEQATQPVEYYPSADGWVEEEGKVFLIGSRCPKCGRHAFPRRAFCDACGTGAGLAHRVIVLGLAADEARLDMVRRMGYDVVITDREDPVEAVRTRTAGRGVELALDVSGGRGTLSLAVDLVRLGGQIGIIGLSPEAPFNPTTVATKEVTIYGSFRRQPSTWLRAIKLVASRKIDVRPLITHRVPVAKAKEVFEILLHREGIKALITPD